MEDLLGPLLLVTYCMIVSSWEHRRFNTYITPFGVMAWPYVAVVVMINLGGKYFGFFPVSLESILFVLACLTFFVVGGQGIAWFVARQAKVPYDPRLIYQGEDVKSCLDLYRPLFVFLAIVSIAAGTVHFFQAVNETGWINVGSKEFSVSYGTGVLAHVQNLSRLAFIFLFADFLYHRRKTFLILLVLMLLMVLVRQVKYHVFIMLLGGLYFSYMANLIRISWTKVVGYAAGIYLIFNLSFVIGFSISGLSHAYSSYVQAFLFNHFFTYLFGGPIAFSEVLKHSAYPIFSFSEIAAVPINMMKVLQGDPRFVDVIIHNWVNVSTIHKYFHSANVFGLFGMLWIYIGSLWTFIYLFLSGCLFYAIHSLARVSFSRIGVRLLISFIMGFLTLSFFAFYFNMLTFVEVSLSMLLLPPLYLAIRKMAKVTALMHRIALSKGG